MDAKEQKVIVDRIKESIIKKSLLAYCDSCCGEVMNMCEDKKCSAYVRFLLAITN